MDENSAHNPWALWAVLFSVALIGLPTLAYPPGPDQSVFILLGDAWFKGQIPYRDLWDAKPPGIFLIYGLARGVFGQNLWSVRLLDLLWTLGTCACLYVIGLRYLSRRAGLAAAFLYGFHVMIQSYWELGQTDGMTGLLSVLAIVLVSDALKNPDRLRSAGLRAFIAGLAMGAAVLLKLTAVLLVPALFAVLIVDGGLRQQVTRAQTTLMALALVGIAAGPLAILAYFAVAGGAVDLLETIFVWGPRYAFQGAHDPLEVLAGGSVLTHRNLWAIPLLTAPALAGIVAELATGRGRRLVVPFFLLAGAVAMTVIQFKFYRYHWMAIYPALALLAGNGIALAIEAIREVPARRARGLAFLGLGLAMATAVPLDAVRIPTSARWWLKKAGGELDELTFFKQFTLREPASSYSFADDLQTARAIQSMTEEGDTLFVWGFEPALYFLSDREPATRFVSHFPVAARWTPDAWRKELMVQLEAKRPGVIVISRKDSGSWITGYSGDTASLLRNLPELVAFLDEHYAVETRIGYFDLYRRLP